MKSGGWWISPLGIHRWGAGRGEGRFSFGEKFVHGFYGDRWEVGVIADERDVIFSSRYQQYSRRFLKVQLCSSSSGVRSKMQLVLAFFLYFEAQNLYLKGIFAGT